MEYRKFPRGDENISTLGIGGEYLEGLSTSVVVDIVDYAISQGINILDVFMPGPNVRDNLGIALKGRREKMFIQGHLCTTAENGQYRRTRNLDETKRSFDDLLTRLKTDYIDFGMIHYVDKEEDFEHVLASGIYEYAKELKKLGVIRHLGFSSHNPVIANKFIDMGGIDILMFSINAAYDLDSMNNDDVYALMDFKGLKGKLEISSDRASLYTRCEHDGIGITVMKTLAAGRLLRAEDSPFGKALSVPQCMHYCLTRPAVLSCMIGVSSLAQLKEALEYFELNSVDKDYSFIAGTPRFSMTGKCMYCSHCLPCPSGIDIASVNKYLDLATIGKDIPQTVKEHYFLLENTAKDCVQCGSCEKNCPFGVDIRAKMKVANRIFGA